MPLPDNVPPPPPHLKPPESALKETYLQLLPHPVLVSLVLALDRNHDAVIWPSDLPSAIDSLREYAKRLYAPSKTPIAPIAPAALPPSVGPHNNGPNRTTGHPIPISTIPPTTTAARHLPTQIVPRIPPPQPTPVPTYASSGYGTGGYGSTTQSSVRVGPPRNQTGRPPNGPGSGGMPSYEEMIVTALEELHEPDGLAPKTVFDYMNSHWTLMNNFRPSASQALQKAYKRGRLEKVGGKYRLNPNWEGGNTSKRATRRPQMGENENQSPPTAPSTSTSYPFPWSRPTAIPSSANSYGSARYSSQPGILRQGISTSSSLPSGSRLFGGSKGNLVLIKQESAEEDELEDDHDDDDDDENAKRIMNQGAAPMTLRQTITKLAQLLADSVKQENDEPGGAG